MALIISTFDPPPTRSRKQHMADIRRECFKHKLSHLNDDAEKAIDFVRDLRRGGEDVTAELSELEGVAYALLLVIGAQRLEIERESNNG
jgi:hypothetical protein